MKNKEKIEWLKALKINALTFRVGGVNTSNNATFRLCDLKSNLMFLLRKIKEYCYSFVVTSKSLCHPEFSSGSQDYEMLKQVQHDNKLYLTFRKALAFTLAETLIVMGIIGVVAALTIPNLNSSTGEKEKVAKVKKLYSNLNDAFERAQAVYGPLDEWFEGDATQQAQSTRFAERMTEFMKVSKTCKFTAGCFSSGKLLNYDGSEYDSNYVQQLISDGTYMIITADGTSVGFDGGTFSSRIRIDIDGPNKGPNKIGTDIFDFSISETSEGQQKNVLTPSMHPAYWTGNFGRGDIFVYSTAWVIQTGNMDYLKLNSSSKCPNGKNLNWQTQTSCK